MKVGEITITANQRTKVINALVANGDVSLAEEFRKDTMKESSLQLSENAEKICSKVYSMLDKITNPTERAQTMNTIVEKLLCCKTYNY